MPCSVIIHEVLGEITSPTGPLNKPDLMQVKGIAQGCQKVLVNSDYTDPDGIIVPVNFDEGQPEGTWVASLAVLEGANCECGSEIRVRAMASPYNPDCQGVNIFTEKLKCYNK